MSNTFGEAFRVTTWGESHGVGVGVVIDGCPPRIPLTVAHIQEALNRRRPGQSSIVTPRNEADQVEILSGVQDGVTLGTPIALSVRNADQHSASYDEMKEKYRPSHADYTYDAKYGIRAWAGGGRASARETIGRVAAGAVAQAVMNVLAPDMDIVAWVSQAGLLVWEGSSADVTRAAVESNPVRTPDAALAEKMEELITQIKAQGNSIGGTVSCVVRGCPAGLGDPVFDKLDATLAHAMMSIPAVKGFEVGSGFASTVMTGEAHNDHFYMDGQQVRTATNNSGGIQGGISNGEVIEMRLAFKPTATIMMSQPTVDVHGHDAELCGRGRHDACVLPRAVPVVEAMAWICLCDHFLRWRGQCGVNV